MSYTIGIDLGGSNIVAGLVDEKCRIVELERARTNPPRPVEALCDDMAQLVRRLMRKAGIGPEKVGWVGVGSPGIIWDGVICYATHLHLKNAPLARLLAERVHLPVYLQNDADTAAWAEYTAGVGRGCHSMVVLTLGTGIGSSVIVEGRIQNGFNGAASELGHTTIHPGGRTCVCGRKGCFEAYCAAPALVRATRRAMEKHPESGMWELCGGDIKKAGGRTSFQGLRMGDPAAAGVVDEYITYLSIGVANLINLLQPEVLCIGGGVSKEGDGLILPLREKVEKLTFAGRGGARTRLVAARLLNDAGIVGAAMLGNLPSRQQELAM